MRTPFHKCDFTYVVSPPYKGEGEGGQKVLKFYASLANIGCGDALLRSKRLVGTGHKEFVGCTPSQYLCSPDQERSPHKSSFESEDSSLL